MHKAPTLPHHLVNAGKSDKLTNIHYNDKLDESPPCLRQVLPPAATRKPATRERGRDTYVLISFTECPRGVTTTVTYMVQLGDSKLP